MKISVLIAAYRAGPYLRTDALTGSLARQTHSDWELVVVEDGSHDETESVVRAFADSRPTQSIRYENNGRNRGVATTRNRLLALAEGDAVAFLDADDWWSPGHLAAGARHILAGDELVVAGVSMFDLASGRELGVVIPPDVLATDPVATLFNESVIITSSAVMLTRGLITRTGEFDLDFSVGEDRDYWLRAALTEARFGISRSLTCHYAKHAASIFDEPDATCRRANGAVLLRKTFSPPRRPARAPPAPACAQPDQRRPPAAEGSCEGQRPATVARLEAGTFEPAGRGSSGFYRHQGGRARFNPRAAAGAINEHPTRIFSSPGPREGFAPEHLHARLQR